MLGDGLVPVPRLVNLLLRHGSHGLLRQDLFRKLLRGGEDLNRRLVLKNVTWNQS